MKAHCDRLGLLNAFAMVASVAPSRSPKPILQNLKFIVDEDGATLMATDLEVGIRHRVLGVDVDSPGSVILPTAKFGSILKAWDDDEVHLSTDDQHLHVRGARSKYKLGLEDPALFPESPEFDAADAYFEVAPALLRTAIRRTVFATDVESARYALGGILVEHEAKSNRLTFVATDGRRLARMVIDAAVAGDVGDAEASPLPSTIKPVIPVKAAKLIDKVVGGLAEDDAAPIHLAFDRAAVSVRTESATIYARLVEGRFPRYTDVFPTSYATKIPLIAGSFRRAVEQAAIATADESRGVDFVFEVGNLKLSASAADVGAADVELPIDYDGIPARFALDPRYILDALATVGPETRFDCSANDPSSAVLFESPDDYSYVAMPLTRDM